MKESPGKRHALASPVVEVFSVSIHFKPDNNITYDGRPFDIYGTVRVIDGERITHVLYSREQDQPESVYPDGTLTLTGPHKAAAIVASNTLAVEVQLMDKARNLDVARGCFSVDYTTNSVEFGKGMRKCVDGPYTFASFNFTTYLFAVLAYVEVEFNKLVNENDVFMDTSSIEDDDGSDLVNDVYGNIVVQSDIQPPDGVKSDYFSSVLFSKSQNQPFRVESGKPIELSRCWVAVPAYSSLKLELNLVDCDAKWIFDKQVVEFPARGRVSFRNKKNVWGEGVPIRVIVKWDTAFYTPYKDYDLFKSKIKNKSEDVNEEPLITSYRRPRPVSSTGESRKLHYWQQFDVLSVVVGRYDHGVEPFRIYGRVEVEDGFVSICIFERDENDAEVVSPSAPTATASLSLTDPKRSFVASNFKITADLKDVGGQVISNDIMWMEPYRKYLYDMPLCSVIRGDHGFAAIHYIIYSKGVEAKVKVSFHNSNNNGSIANVCGKLVARSTYFDFSSWYEREYYRAVLFNKHPQNSIQLTTGSELPLSKTSVAVQHGYLLVIEADLEVSYDSGVNETRQVVDVLKGSAELEAMREGTCSQKIEGQNCYIELSVKWGHAPGRV